MKALIIALLILITVIVFTNTKETFHTDGSSLTKVASGTIETSGSSVNSGSSETNPDTYDKLIPYHASLGMSDAPSYLVDLYAKLNQTYRQSQEDAKFDNDNKAILNYIVTKKLDWRPVTEDQPLSLPSGKTAKCLVER